jgi:threonine dehydratase
MYKQLLAARERLRGQSHITPVCTSGTLDSAVGAQVFLKCENFQRMGAFKFRGAYNTISQLGDAEKRRGVIAYSSGNHAQAVALVSQILGIKATIVMPEDAPRIKLRATRGYGAEVVTYDTEKTTREELTAEIASEKGYVTIPPFDHEDIVAGQGTAAAELHEAITDLDIILAPCGGGGLLSGTAIATRGINPKCRVVGVEPRVADDATKSFHTRTLHTIRNPPTIADGTRTSSLGKITFPLILEYVDDMVTVTEDAIKEAVRFLFYRMKLVVEPSGALGVAALLSGALQTEGRVGIVISGGNIDGETMSQIMREAEGNGKKP